MPGPQLSTPVPNASPFLLRVQDVEMLSSSTGFSILREYLAENYNYDLCDAHTPAHLENLSRWLVVRDSLHALLVPIVELFDKAVGLAAAATHATRLEDLEHAFSGDARSAFLWLQCFLASEKELDWCYTRGCPACVVEHSLDSEFSVRLLYAACLLSDVHYPFTIDGPTLPSFVFFLDALQRALALDPLFGADYFDRLHPRAVATRNAIEELIRQCVDLDALLLSQPATPALGSPDSSVPASPVLAPLGDLPGSAGKAKLRVRRSRLARRQMSLQVEEEQWMDEMFQRCWDHLEPEDGGLLPQSLDAAVKPEPQVQVRELTADAPDRRAC